MPVNHETPIDRATPPAPDAAERSPVDRRAILAMALGAGAAAFLTACGSTPTRNGRVGDPIPGSPDYRPLAGGTRPPLRRPNYGNPRANLPETVTVLNRQTWATRGPVVTRANRMGQIRSITVHHDGMSPYYSTLYDDTARRLESIRNSHVGRGWADIGYHYAIDPSGRVWACRPESLQGAHVKDYNPGNLGILVLGNYEEQRPTAASTRTLDLLIAAKMDEHRLNLRSVYTHREWASTACPGRHLQTHMQTARASGGPIDRAVATVAFA
jgi:hypothetical protein